MTKRKRQTTAEFLAELQRDPDYVDRIQKRDARIAHTEQELNRAEASLVQDLRAAGANIESVWDLVNSKRRYPSLIPTLLSHLQREYPERIREGIARALAVPDARVGWNNLVQAFMAESGPVDPVVGVNEMKWSLHLAIAAAADVSVIDELIGLVVDRRRHGPHRSFFIDALARLRDPRARAALDELKNDPDLVDAFKRLAKKQGDRKRRSSK
jgi:hypothetical protein